MNTDKTLKYSSIAISGRPGAGRSTLLKNLKPYLEKMGWEFFSGGEWSRTFAVEKGLHRADDPSHHNASQLDDEIDLQIDKGMRKKLEDPSVHVAIESWIAGWNMRGLKHVLKVLLVCDDSLRVDRIVNRDSFSVEEAKNHIRERETINLTKWKRMYGVDNFWDPSFYDIIIDTYSTGPMETLGKVLDKIGYKNHT